MPALRSPRAVDQGQGLFMWLDRKALGDPEALFVLFPFHISWHQKEIQAPTNGLRWRLCT